MKLQEFLDCEHDIDMNSVMTRLYCVKCGQDANVINHVRQLETKLALAVSGLSFYANKENCSNPESCFIFEIDKDGDEIADEGYTARQTLAEIKGYIQ